MNDNYFKDVHELSSYTFDDVLIVPTFSDIESRTTVDIKSYLTHKSHSEGKDCIDIPIISANMKDITGATMCKTMIKLGAWGILHRFNRGENGKNPIEEGVEEYLDVRNSCKYPTDCNNLKNLREPGVSIGVQPSDKDRFLALHSVGAKIFCIDVAHGQHAKMKRMIEFCKNHDPNVVIIAGNVATGEGLLALAQWGADVVKVGIGGGSVCDTRANTGVGVPQLTALEAAYNACSTLQNPVKIISDGGCKKSGDIVKALKFADLVMLGGMLKGTSETPGNCFPLDGDSGRTFYKVYGGSSAFDTKKHDNFIEGSVKTVPFMGKVKYLVKPIKQNIQSGFSYVGARNHSEFVEKCRFIRLSSGGKSESKL